VAEATRFYPVDAAGQCGESLTYAIAKALDSAARK